MDRSTFLKAQPFLYPLDQPSSSTATSSSCWPPPLPVETSERRNCRRETLLKADFWLSIEHIEHGSYKDNQSQKNPRCLPAFFAAPSRKELKPSSSQSNDTDILHPHQSGKSSSKLSASSFDPAMASIQLAMQSSTLTLAQPRNTSSASRSTDCSSISPVAYQILLKKQQQQQQLFRQTTDTDTRINNPLHQENGKFTSQVTESTIYLNIEGDIFQLDVDAVTKVELSEGDTTTRPPSLWIEFGFPSLSSSSSSLSYCGFRIFPMMTDCSISHDDTHKTNSTANTKMKSDKFSLLRTAHSVFNELMDVTNENHVVSEYPFPYMYHWTSPAGSSTVFGSNSNTATSTDGLSQEPGQKDTPQNSASAPHRQLSDTEKAGMQSGATDKGNSQPSLNRSSSTDKSQGISTRDGDSQVATLKHQAHFLKARNAVKNLNNMLWQTVSNNDTSNQGSDSQAQLQLNPVSEHLAASYCSTSQLTEAIQQKSGQVLRTEVDVDKIVQAFWQTSSRKGNGRHLSSTWNTIERRPQIQTEECITQTEELLQMRRNLIQEKLNISLLLTRGS